MKKRPFILVELLICIAILSICAIPLLGYPYYSYKKQRELLLSIEKQRQAEILFYDLLKNFDVSWEEISFEYTNKKDLDPLTINIKGLGPTTLYPHYHLYVHPKAKETKTKKGIAKLWCCFCMEETKDRCTISWADHTPYTFNLFAKKVEEKEANASKEN
ncbi:MAG: type II secretion system protein [Simkaniaceae bacterium]